MDLQNLGYLKRFGTVFAVPRLRLTVHNSVSRPPWPQSLGLLSFSNYRIVQVTLDPIILVPKLGSKTIKVSGLG